MQILKNKSKISTIALVLVLTFVATFVALPVTTAQEIEVGTKMTFAYIGAIPNPVGVGQTVLLHVGITEPLVIKGDTWKGLWVTIEKPDGTTEKIENIETDPTGGTGKTWTPDRAGTYYLQTHFPEQWYNYTAFDFTVFRVVTRHTLYQASTSEKLELIVQDEKVPYYPGVPLPTEYWTRPIDAQLREWSTIAGSWLTTPQNLFAPYNEGPESAHILWVKPLTTGGIVGGELYGHSFEIGDAYEGKWAGSSGPLAWLSSSIILAGRLYYQHTTTDPHVVYHCVDLHTGEELWSKTFLNNQTIAFGQLFDWEGFNLHGTYAYLWVTVGSTWYAFDAFTGDWQYTMEGVPSGTNLYGPQGEIFRYTVDLQGGNISLWNSTRVVMAGIPPPNSGSWGFNAQGGTHNASRGIQWTKPIPTGLPGSVLKIFLMDRVIGGSVSTTEVNLWGLDLRPGKEGDLLFNNTWAAPPLWDEGKVTLAGFQGGFMAWSQEDKVGVLWVKETREHYGFSLEDGDYLWGPTPSQYYLDAVEDTPAESRAIAYGRLYSASVGGVLYCYNVTTGKLLWEYHADDPYQEFLFANDWWLKPLFITDGKIYVGHTEHSPIDPRPRGAPCVCVDAITGDEIWRANGLFRQTRWGGRAIIGDSIIATMDTYDQRVYAIGKGPSATTVSIQNDVITKGSSVLVKGTVMDVSPGVEEYALTARFPNGVPAIGDEYMSEWMGYVYKQLPCPTNLNGVPVKLEAFGEDGSYLEIGTVTSDPYGNFNYLWTPTDENLYTVMATFEGSKSYFSSYAATGLSVGAAPPEPVTPATQPEVQEDINSAIDSLTPMFIGLIVAVVIAIVIGVLNLWALRKRT